jgi:hypothetical protein
MAGHHRTKITLTAGTAVLSALAFAAPAHAANAYSQVTYVSKIRAEAYSYGANGAVKVCDRDADGYSVAVRYFRVTGNTQILRNTLGNTQCAETSDIQSNPIQAFEACVRIESVDYCNTTWSTTGRG